MHLADSRCLTHCRGLPGPWTIEKTDGQVRRHIFCITLSPIVLKVENGHYDSFFTSMIIEGRETVLYKLEVSLATLDD